MLGIPLHIIHCCIIRPGGRLHWMASPHNRNLWKPTVHVRQQRKLQSINRFLPPPPPPPPACAPPPPPPPPPLPQSQFPLFISSLPLNVDCLSYSIMIRAHTQRQTLMYGLICISYNILVNNGCYISKSLVPVTSRTSRLTFP